MRAKIKENALKDFIEEQEISIKLLNKEPLEDFENDIIDFIKESKEEIFIHEINNDNETVRASIYEKTKQFNIPLYLIELNENENNKQEEKNINKNFFTIKHIAIL
jgi:hypothetical protein